MKPYLEFLMDERVIDVPKWLRTFLVKGIILNTRPKRSAKAYKKIWWDEGSPLIVLSERLQAKIQHKTSVPIALAMRYGKPSIATGLAVLQDQGVDDVLLVPLYPQHAMATTETIIVLAEQIQAKTILIWYLHTCLLFTNTQIIFVCCHSQFQNIYKKNWEHILFSYHGIPERHLRKTDITKSHCKPDQSCCKTPSVAHEYCYRHQCYETTRLVAEYWN